MKEKFIFGLQVFMTLILYMAIFITYLEGKDVQPVEISNHSEIISTSTVSSESFKDRIANTFTATLSRTISCGK